MRPRRTAAGHHLKDLEVLTVGRVGVDLYPEQPGPIADVETFAKSVGGTATNVAVAAARLGRRAAVLTKVGDDALGDYVRQALGDRFRVDTRFVGVEPKLPTPVVFAELDPPEQPRILFYRYPKAPDMTLTLDDVDLDAAASVPILWVAGDRFSDEPSRSTALALLEARHRRRHTILDLDYRPSFWASVEEAGRWIGGALGRVTVAVGNRAECEVAVGTAEPGEAAERLLARGLELAIVKLGGEGVLVAAVDGTRELIPPVPVEVVCGLGAGDAFGGALCHGLLEGWDAVRAARFANVAGAIVASRLLCAEAMPTLSEIAQLEARTPTP
jgi:5-dehydro-2-deoxygluconokinase